MEARAGGSDGASFFQSVINGSSRRLKDKSAPRFPPGDFNIACVIPSQTDFHGACGPDVKASRWNNGELESSIINLDNMDPLSISARRFKIAVLAMSSSRILTNARTTYTLMATARDEFRIVAAISAPCSVNTHGKYFLCCPLPAGFKVTNCDFKALHSSGSNPLLPILRHLADSARPP